MDDLDADIFGSDDDDDKASDDSADKNYVPSESENEEDELELNAPVEGGNKSKFTRLFPQS